MLVELWLVIFEWVQNRIGLYWSLSEVHEKLKCKMEHTFNQVYALMEELNMDMRTASYICALRKLHGN